MSQPAPPPGEQAPGEQTPSPHVTPPGERPWYLRPRITIWLGPLLIIVCLVMRFGWGGIEGPPAPWWFVAYAAGGVGILLTYTGITERRHP